MITARIVPNWMTAETAAPGSPQPRSSGTSLRWPVEEMGMNSVRPWTRPRTIASTMDKSHLPNHRQDQRPPSHVLAEVALQECAHLFLQHVGIAQLGGRTFGKHANE